ncbi:DUF4369 domain-containing protein [Dokdonia sinensis]|uniref:DUF4369 domain-containing protein n=1 Tax=Dokdonia sinensis TaxID=2479847 RepID=A0A3M0GCP1_9FLAO|nr:DUF4369 domain-containing protein [Dokdonia sinensis]RMB60442.1 DUF4369 domain-containing protein [Dokdonia sinensis]
MKNILLFSLIVGLFSGCSKDANFKVTGTVKGLKKGTIYLQQVKDTILVNLDSLVVDGDPDFEFYTDLKEPEVLYLYLDKVDASGYDDRILFFAEPGEMNIITSLKNFESFAAVTGSQNEVKLKEFLKMNSKFDDKNLDLIKASFIAQKNGEQDLILEYDDSLNNLLKTKYRYTGNFAATNKEFEVAPYLLLTQIPDASIAYLDTIYNKFPRKIKSSKYGRDVQKLIETRRKEEVSN